MPLPRVIVSIATLAVCSASWTAAAEDHMAVDRSSTFLRELYKKPVPADYHGLLIASAILTVTENEDDGMMLRRFAKRKALKTFLGEPFEFSGTTEAAIALENGMTPAALAVEIGTTHPASAELDERGNDTYQELRTRALASVTVVAAGDGTLRVSNALREPVSEVAVSIAGADSQSIRLKCKPASDPVFAPNATQAAAQCFGDTASIEALRKAATAKPVGAHTIVVTTENTVIAPNYMRFGGEAIPLANEAWRLVSATSCRQLDNCGDKDRVARRQGESERARALLGILAVGMIVIGLLAWRAKPRKDASRWVPGIAAAVVCTSSLVPIALALSMLSVPNLIPPGAVHNEFFLSAVWGLMLAHVVGVTVLCAAFVEGGLTRFRAFALGYGLLAGLTVWAFFSALPLGGA